MLGSLSILKTRIGSFEHSTHSASVALVPPPDAARAQPLPVERHTALTDIPTYRTLLSLASSTTKIKPPVERKQASAMRSMFLNKAIRHVSCRQVLTR